MVHAPERSPERDAAIAAMLPHVPFDGWTVRALRVGPAGHRRADRRSGACCFPAAQPT